VLSVGPTGEKEARKKEKGKKKKLVSWKTEKIL